MLHTARHRYRTDSTDGGFTLIELIIVIVVIAILAAIAIPMYNSFQRDTKVAAVTQSANAMNTAMYYESGGFDGTVREYNERMNGWLLRATNRTSGVDGDIGYRVIQPPASTINNAKRCVEVYWRTDPDINAYIGESCNGNQITGVTCTNTGTALRVTHSYSGAPVNNIRIALRGGGSGNYSTPPGAAWSRDFGMDISNRSISVELSATLSGTTKSAGASVTVPCN